MSRRRPLTRGELELWRRSTADVTPLKDVSESEPAQPPAAKPTPEKSTTTGGSTKRDTTARKPTTPARKPSKALDPSRPVDIDRRNWERLKRGRVEIDRKLDLHGRTQAEAHKDLDRFLTMAFATGLRCVLVVTGKGAVDGRGILRQMVPRWLDEPDNRDKVLTYSPAQPRHGGDGALYVLLRRRRGGGVS